MTQDASVAVLGAGDLVGEETLRLLAERHFPLTRVYALDTGGAIGEPVDYNDTPLVVGDALGFDYSEVSLVLSSLDRATAAQCLPRAVAAGCTVVDSSGWFEGDSGTPLVVAGVNAAALERVGDAQGRSVAIPGYAVIQALRVLAPLQERFGLTRLNVVVCHPAARSGRGGIERLARGSATALNGQGLESAHHHHGHTRQYGAARPFSLAPLVASQVAGRQHGEPDLKRRLRMMLGQERLEMAVYETLVPVFYDCTLIMDINTQDPVVEETVRQLLGRATGIHVEAGETDVEARLDPDLHVCSLQLSESALGLSLSTVGDAIRCGVAAEQVDVASALLAAMPLS